MILLQRIAWPFGYWCEIGRDGRVCTYKMYFITGVLYIRARAEPHVYIFATSL